MKLISTKVHTIIGLVVGVTLIFASSIFNFTDNTAASMVAMWVGIFIVLNELITTSPSSPLKLVPMKVHLILDIVTGIFLAVSPWLFNFADSDQPGQWVPHLIVGIMVAGYALVTSTDDAKENTRSRS
ncbi:MAG: hypothetical protein JWO54_808 [Candidatus Saccharibacteria bacterium]|nr:hypothetical protein [Candidatus Saccharibacteria bacterium]MDB5181045.1 hypothetical protein [Candidatus Saccharibacteria bacterium]